MTVPCDKDSKFEYGIRKCFEVAAKASVFPLQIYRSEQNTTVFPRVIAKKGQRIHFPACGTEMARFCDFSAVVGKSSIEAALCCGNSGAMIDGSFICYLLEWCIRILFFSAEGNGGLKWYFQIVFPGLYYTRSGCEAPKGQRTKSLYCNATFKVW